MLTFRRVVGLTLTAGLLAATGKVIGGIGVSGVTSQQDKQVAKAGLDALTK